MVWVLSLSSTDLSTRRLTPIFYVPAFGVYPDLIGDEALASNQ